MKLYMSIVEKMVKDLFASNFVELIKDLQCLRILKYLKPLKWNESKVSYSKNAFDH